MVFWLMACAEPTINDRVWIKEVLYADNWRYLQRSPAALEQKFIAMAESEYAFMRGTLSIQLAHWSRRSQVRMPTQFLNIQNRRWFQYLVMRILKTLPSLPISRDNHRDCRFGCRRIRTVGIGCAPCFDRTTVVCLLDGWLRYDLSDRSGIVLD